jgi:hypothetical protein
VSAPRCDYGLWYCDVTDPVSLPFGLDQIDCDDESSLGFSDDPLLPGGRFRAQRLVQLADEEALDAIVRYANVDVRVLWCGACRSECTDGLRSPSRAVAAQPRGRRPSRR